MTHAVRVAFRTGGGQCNGFGHVRRCISLAQALQILEIQSFFLLDGDPEVHKLVSRAGFETISIRPEQDLHDTVHHCEARHADVLVADSYTLSTEYFLGVQRERIAVAVLDDLADHDLLAHLVVNGSAGADQLPYQGSTQTKYLLGPRYILLRPEFAAMPIRMIKDRVERVLITVGGSDPHGLTSRLMCWIAKTSVAVKLDVVVGPLFEGIGAIRKMVQESTETITLHENPEDMRALMLNADLAMCGGGQTTYELAATGTPAIAIRMAKNQTINLNGLSAVGSLVWLGDARDADLEEKVMHKLKVLAGDISQRVTMSRTGQSLVDGRGAQRVALAIQDSLEITHL